MHHPERDEPDAVTEIPHGLIDEEVRPSWDRDIDGIDDDYRGYLADQFDLRMRG